MFLYNKDKKCLEKSGKRSNFVLEKSEKPQSDFCTNPGRNQKLEGSECDPEKI